MKLAQKITSETLIPKTVRIPRYIVKASKKWAKQYKTTEGFIQRKLVQIGYATQLEKGNLYD